ncbi:hypothetical protein RJ639_018736 [Escallonia herrerae]|uniref:Glucose-1-phosphate adenylyltransferase n=1 Tax=Escallonia herrerae TaxID=1293975 RepID=A0AA88V6H6_9ASTE|nr:hypothetical protein RJ639_018736 [Escallonia herrerae]
MAVAADGRIALSAAGQLRGTTGLAVANRTFVKFCNGELMGEKLKFSQLQQRFTGNNVRPNVCMTLTTNVAGEAKVSTILKWKINVLSGNCLMYDVQLRDLEMEKRDPKTVVAIILGGGAGTRLFPLTKRRAKPAVPIGGAYRLIDVPMSNCINSGINKVYILTQFNSASLNRHLARAYNFGGGVTFGDGYVEVLAATQTPGEAGKAWFQGTADAVRQFHWLFEDARSKDIEDVLILSGDHLYRMDYMDFVQNHRQSGADITISSLPMDDSRASDFGLMKIDNKGRVLSFSEKPRGDDLKAMAVDTTILGLSREEAEKKPYIASMGVYVFKKEILLNLLRWRFPTANDFGSEIIPASAREFFVKAYLFNDYWEDIGTIRSFFEANLALTAHPPRFSFYEASKPMFTSRRNLPPSKIDNCKIVDSIISHGSFLTDCFTEHSVVGIRSRINSNVHLKDTVMLGADYYETDVEISSLLAEGRVPIGIGENTKIRECIIDKNARIGKNVIIANSEGIQEADRSSEGFYIRSGITVILKNSTIQDGLVI